MNFSDIGQFVLLDSFLPANYPNWYRISLPISSPILRISYSNSFEAKQIPYYVVLRYCFDSDNYSGDWINLYPSDDRLISFLPDNAKELLNLGIRINLEFSNKIKYSRYSNIESPQITLTVEELIFNEIN